MPTIHLTDEQAQRLMNRLIQSDDLLMTISNQLREQQQAPPEGIVVKRNADGKEARHE